MNNRIPSYLKIPFLIKSSFLTTRQLLLLPLPPTPYLNSNLLLLPFPFAVLRVYLKTYRPLSHLNLHLQHPFAALPASILIPPSSLLTFPPYLAPTSILVFLHFSPNMPQYATHIACSLSRSMPHPHLSPSVKCLPPLPPATLRPFSMTMTTLPGQLLLTLPNANTGLLVLGMN